MPPQPPSSRNGASEVVVARVEREARRRRSRAPASRSVVACLTATTFALLARELRDRARARGSGSRAAGCCRGSPAGRPAASAMAAKWRAHALDRRLVVVRRDGQEAVHAERGAPRASGARSARCRRCPCSRSTRASRADLVEHRLEQRELLGVGRASGPRRSCRRARGPRSRAPTRWRASARAASRSSEPSARERRHHRGADAAERGGSGAAALRRDSRAIIAGVTGHVRGTSRARPSGRAAARARGAPRAATPGTNASREVASWRIVSSSPVAAEQRLLVRDQARQPHRVDRHVVPGHRA